MALLVECSPEKAFATSAPSLFPLVTSSVSSKLMNRALWAVGVCFRSFLPVRGKWVGNLVGVGDKAPVQLVAAFDLV